MSKYKFSVRDLLLGSAMVSVIDSHIQSKSKKGFLNEKLAELNANIRRNKTKQLGFKEEAKKINEKYS